MGQLADDIVEGRSCSECGVYFKNAHGYPVLCEDCYEEGDELPLANEKEL